MITFGLIFHPYRRISIRMGNWKECMRHLHVHFIIIDIIIVVFILALLHLHSAEMTSFKECIVAFNIK